MNDKPKEPDAEAIDDPVEPDADAAPERAAPIEAEWEEAPAEPDDEPSDEPTEDAESEDAETEDAETEDALAEPENGPEIETAAAAMAGAAAGAAVGAAASSADPADAAPQESKSGVGVVAYVWLGLLTLAVLYVLYVLMADPAGLRARLAIGDAPEIAAARSAGAKAAEQATANAAAIAELAAKAPEAPPQDPAIARLESDIGRMEAAAATMRAELEAAIAAASASPPTAGAPVVDDATKQAIANAAQAIASINSSLAALKANVDGGLADLSDVKDRVAALEKRAERASGRALAAAILTLNDLKVGVASGKPFGTLLQRAQAASPDAMALKGAAWTEFADAGLPTDDALLADMQKLSVSIGQDKLKDRLSSGESWLDRAVGGVVDRLKVRRVGADVAGDEPAAVAARAEAALLDGDVAKAIAEVETLSGEDAARFEGWLAGAKAAVAAKTDIDAVEQAAIAAADGA